MNNDIFLLSLEDKIALSLLRIEEFLSFTDNKAYISFSGGKDSLVVRDLVRRVNNNIKCVFSNTGLEHPNTVPYIKSFNDVIFTKPKKTFKEVIEKYGWVFPSKIIARNIYGARIGTPTDVARMQGLKNDGTPLAFGDALTKWQWLRDREDIKISEKCCYHLKKSPMKALIKDYGLPFLGVRATESKLRQSVWEKKGCNIYSKERGSSKPISFWTDQDVLRYIQQRNLPLNPVYGDIMTDKDGRLYTTGMDRTGCIFCPIGVHLDKKDKKRFLLLKKSYPKMYNYIIHELNLKVLLDALEERYPKCRPLY